MNTKFQKKLIKTFLDLIKIDNPLLEFAFEKLIDEKKIKYQVLIYVLKEKTIENIIFVNTEEKLNNINNILEKKYGINTKIKHEIKQYNTIKELVNLIINFDFFSFKEKGYNKLKKIKKVSLEYRPHNKLLNKLEFHFGIDFIGHINNGKPSTKLIYDFPVNEKTKKIIREFLKEHKTEKILNLSEELAKEEKEKLKGLDEIVKEILNNM